MIIINTENLILGRMATVVAKKALLGEQIRIINCEKAVLTGSKKNILEKYKARRARGQFNKGPYIPRRPDMFVKRAIRGMLPYKQEKGRNAFESVKCYLGVPEEFKDKETEVIENANINKIQTLKFMFVGDICKELGSKWQR